MRVRRRSTPSPRSTASESVWGFVFALLAGSRWAGAAVAVIVASMLMTGAPAALALDEATSAPQTAGAPSPAPHVHRPPAAPDDLRAQQTPTPDDEIPDVALTLGGASHTVDVEGYFTDSVNGYEVRASPDDIVHTSRSGTVITIKPLAAGSATVTVIGKKSGSDERKQFTVTVSAMVAAPTATGSIAAATVTEGATHAVTASDYFEGEGAMYTAESSDPAVATVAVDGAVVTVTAVAAGSATVKVTATNAGGSAEQSFAVTVAPPAPAAVGSIAAATLTEGATHMVTASDYFEGEGAMYAAESSDPAVATVAVDGAVVTVTAVAAGRATITVTATNAGGSAEQAFAVTVAPLAPTAVGSIEAVTLTEGDTHAVTASGYFVGEGVTYAAESSDTEVARVAVEGAALTVTAVAVGSATVTVAATNAGGSVEQSFAVTVVPPAPLAVGSIEAATLTEGATHMVTASDHFAGEGVTYTAESSDMEVATVAVDGATVTVTGVAAGSAAITVTAANAGGSAEQSFAVTVLPPAPATVGSVAAVTLTGRETHAVTASDYFVGEGAMYTAQSSDTEVATVAVEGAVVRVTAVATGSATVTVTATNAGGSAEQSFAVTVLPPAPATVGSVAAVTLTEGAPHFVTASDYFAGEGVTYAAGSSDTEVATVAVEGATVLVTGVAAGRATITVTATNAGGSAEQRFAVTVVPPAPPAPTAVGSIAAVTLTEGATRAVTASDYFAGEGVAYTAESSNAEVAMVAVDGVEVTVTAVAVGSTTITVTATNAGGSAAQSFAVTVVPPAPSAPTATGSIEAATLTEGGTHAVAASDYFEGAGLAYAAESSDAAVATVAVEGAVVTVTAVATGSATITVTATNAGGSAEQAFAVTVVPSAPAAVGSIEVATLTEGATHMVTASDHFEGEGATYTAESSDPAVATVAVDGAVVTVTAAAVGSATVTVTATNAGGSAEQRFAVTVQPPPVTLTLGGAAQAIELSEHFGDAVAGFDVSVSPAGVVQASMSGSLLTLTPLGVGTATVTLEVTAGEVSALHQFPATVAPAAPTALGSIAALTLADRETHTVSASEYFAGEGVTYDAEFSDPGVATVAVDGAAVTVTAIAAGEATVTVTATNESGKAEQSFVVTVQLPAIALTLGGAAREIELADYFGDEVTGYEVTVSPSGIVHVSRSGSQLTLTGVAAGRATITVTATNVGGSAEQAFAVTVVSPAPTAVGSIEAATLTEGATHMVTASDYFEGEGVTYTAESSDTGVATVAVDGAAVTVTAVATGSATVTVTATNAGGSARQSFAVTVQLPPVTLTFGGAAQAIELSEHFGDAVTGFDVSVSPAGIVQVSMSGSLLTLTPLAVGTATVTLEVTAGEVSASHQFPATVVPAAPTALGSIAALTLAERETHTVTASDYFAGESATYDAESSDPGVATVAVDGAAVTVTAIAAGEATVTVTATNESGKAEQSFVVTIQLPVVTLTLGGAAREIELADYFGDEVTGYEVTVSPSGIVHVSRSGSQLTLTAVIAGSATITVTATNAGGSAEQRFAVTVAPPAPAAVGSIEAATINEGATRAVTASDYFEGEGAMYAAESSDMEVATVAVEGAVVTVTGVAAGSATITVAATNAGGSAEQAFAVTVAPSAPTAVGAIPAATTTLGATHLVTASEFFAGESVTYTAESSDTGVATVAVDGAVVTVTAVAAGSATITVAATNAGGSAEQAFAVTVVPSAPAAVGSIEAVTLTEGATRAVTASDYFEGAGLAYGAESSDAALTTVAVDGAVVTVTAVAAGSATITVTATNAGGGAEQSFAVTVLLPAPLAPTAVASIEAATLTEGATHMVTASGYFVGEGVTYAAESSDMEVATVAVEGAVVTVTAVAAGSATITVTATNAGGSAEQSFAVTVVPPAPPAPLAVGSIEAATLTEGATHMVTASDHFVGEGVTYTAESSDTGVATVAVEGAAVTVTGGAAGSATITVTATNAGGSAEQAFAVTVLPRAPTPVGSIEAMTLAEGGAAQAVDLADYFSGAVVRYSVSAVPAGIVHVWELGGRLTLTPLATGVATVTVTALGAGGSAGQTFAVTVQARVPRALGAVPLTMLTEGEVLPLDAAAYFEGTGVAYTARSSNAGVAAVEVHGSSVLVRAVAVGGATVTVVAANGSGSAEQNFVVVVSPRAPRAAGSMADQTLIAGGAALETDLPGYFSGAFTRYGATATPGGVVHLWESGGRLTLTPLAAGAATVTVWATNSSGSATQSFEVVVKQRAPKALAGGMPLSLTEGGAPHEIDLADYFGGAVARYEVTTVPGGVVHLWQSGGRLTVTPLSTGIATVTVTATNDSGSSVQGFDLAVAPAAPRTLGGIPDVALHEGGATREIALADYFDGASVSYEATARPDGIVHLWESGGRLRLTALAAGVAMVEVTAANASGSVSQLFAVTVESEAPRALGRIEGVTLTVGGDAWDVALADHFAGVVERYVAAAEPGGVVHLWESDGRLRLTPLAAGIATVTATAINTAGSAEQAFAIAVAPAAPRALGGIAGVTLAEGGEAPEVDLSDYFGGMVDRYVVTADPVGVVHVWESGGRLTLTPLASGSASVMVTALNGSGSAAQGFAVIVEPPAAVGP